MCSAGCDVQVEPVHLVLIDGRLLADVLGEGIVGTLRLVHPRQGHHLGDLRLYEVHGVLGGLDLAVSCRLLGLPHLHLVLLDLEPAAECVDAVILEKVLDCGLAGFQFLGLLGNLALVCDVLLLEQFGQPCEVRKRVLNVMILHILS